MENVDYSLFMQDNSEGDHGKEAMLDYQMSWLMRLAAETKVENKRLHQISKEVLLRLIGLLETPNVDILNVDVWRQWEHIDVFAEIKVVVDGETQHHLVVIEDKAYTMIHDNQLTRYAETVRAYYSGKRKNNYTIHYWVITFHDEGSDYWKQLKEDCEKCDIVKWNLLNMYDVIGWRKDKENDFKNTESDLFDEFWLKKWY